MGVRELSACALGFAGRKAIRAVPGPGVQVLTIGSSAAGEA